MDSARGYYTLVQYCPDASRLETVNLGVALYCPEASFLKVRFGRSKTRIRGVFGPDQDWDFVERQESAVRSRLEREVGSVEDLELYISRRANAVTMTPLRPMKVMDAPDKELDELFRRLVVSQTSNVRRQQRRSLNRELAAAFREAGVVDRMERVRWLRLRRRRLRSRLPLDTGTGFTISSSRWHSPATIPRTMCFRRPAYGLCSPNS